MFRASFCAGFLTLMVAVPVLAQVRPKLEANTASPVPNLIDESSRLKVLQEESIQKEVSKSRHTYGIGYTVMSAKKLEILANERLTRYNDVQRPGISGQIGYLPFRYRGYLGLIGSIGYNYGENTGTFAKTSLHWIAADIALAYRYEASERAYIKPFVSLGGGYNVLVQRGPSYYNTSEARGVGIATVGAGLNLNRTLRFETPLMWELTARYRKVIDQEDRGLNFNGEQYALGLELAL